MKGCKNCNGVIAQGEIKGCPNCGAEFCQTCSEKTKNICPYCYYDLEYKG